MKKILLASAFVSTIGGSAYGQELTPGDAIIQTQEGVFTIISCENKNNHPICEETGTDDIFNLEG